MGKTKISWTDRTWNPTRGCRRVSPGCEHCYAEQVAGRFCGPGQAYEGLAVRKLRVISDDEQRSVGRWTGKGRFVAEHLADPLTWRKPQRVFVNSMSDLFFEEFTNEEIAAVFGVMAVAHRHTFQILTKRPERMREWFTWFESTGYAPGQVLGNALHEVADASLDGTSPGLDDQWVGTFTDDEWQCHLINVVNGVSTWRGDDRPHEYGKARWPLPNVWIGVSVENQAAADERIPELLATPAAVRFLSCEPLLGPVTLPIVHVFGGAPVPRHIDWVIAGCESGYGMRPCDVAWLRSLRDQCADAEVPFFLKQAVKDNRAGRFGSEGPVAIGHGHRSKKRGGGIIELPYLDGVQHANFPAVAP